MRFQLLAMSLLVCFGCNKPASEATPSAQSSSAAEAAGPQTESLTLLVGVRGEETPFPNPDAALIEEKLRSLDWTIPRNRIYLNRKEGKNVDNMFIESRDGQLYASHLAFLWIDGNSTTPTAHSKTFESIDTALQILLSHLNRDDKYETLVEWEHNSFPRKSDAPSPKP